MYTENTTLSEFLQVFEQWRDSRVIPRDDLKDVASFAMVPDLILSEFGYGYRGHSFRQNKQDVRLTVKVDSRGIPLVAFITGKTTTHCVRKFLDKLGEDDLRWSNDRYA